MEVDDEDDDWSGRADLLVVESTGATGSGRTSSRIILHFDLDCFYAQVEMIRNPALRNKPLGIQQKYIIVTCNYVARDLGVTKLMSVTDALERCPQLVLVKGEDLTHYREMSYKVTELLMSYCPLVERLGFDENFVDVTDMVDTRIRQTNSSTDFTFSGHVYNKESSDVSVSDHPRLAVGSHLAAEMREAIRASLALTSCAGVATNKLLAKLVSGTFKPNQQTTLLPENTADIMASLSGVRKVPGIGHSTGHRLKALGLATVRDLQCFPSAELAREFGATTAQRLQNLAQGIDDSPVTPAGPPQSLSDEDSFKKISSTTEVLQKVEELLTSLTERMQKDGRQPSTFRLTIRRFSATNRYFSRESRQCPIPNHIAQKITSGSSEALTQLVKMAMKLFHKMVDINGPFHLTLINVCFSNLHAKSDSRAAITSFFTHKSPKKVPLLSPQQETPETVTKPPPHILHTSTTSCTSFGKEKSDKISSQKASPASSKENKSTFLKLLRPSPLLPVKQPLAPPGCPQDSLNPNGPKEPQQPSHNQPDLTTLPPDVDPEVFRHLPESIQQELLSSFQTGDHVYNHRGTSTIPSSTAVTGSRLQTGEHGYNHSGTSTIPSATAVTGSRLQTGEHVYNHSRTSTIPSATAVTGSRLQTGEHEYNHHSSHSATRASGSLHHRQAGQSTATPTAFAGLAEGDSRVRETSAGGCSGQLGTGGSSDHRQSDLTHTQSDHTVRECSLDSDGGGSFFSTHREAFMRTNDQPVESSRTGDCGRPSSMAPTACSHLPSGGHTSNVNLTVRETGGGGGGSIFSTRKESSTNYQLPGSISSSQTRTAGDASDVVPAAVSSSTLPHLGQHPSNVDPAVFSELPPELQRELLAEWRQQKLVLKMPSVKKTGKAQDRTTTTSKDRKHAATKGCQANSLLKYFKPN